jgi:hypothetical protein
MADEFSFSVDSDWKKQAQEEKRRLAEEAEQKKSAATETARPPTGTAGAATGDAATAGRRRRAGPGEEAEASFMTLVQTLAAQALAYLGGMAMAGGEPMIDLDTAKQQIDLMAVLEEKTKGNLSSEEQAALDVALYETRMRYVGVASRYIL